MQLSSNYLNSITSNTDFVNKIRIETLMGLIAENHISHKQLILGDDGSKKIPDIYSTDLTEGYEIVQCELDCDLEMWKIYDAIRKYKNNYDSVINHLKSIGFCINDYSFYKTKEGTIGSFSHIEFGRSDNYLKNNFERNINNKLIKLNKGNYDRCSKINLIISSINRARGYLDAQCIMEIYNEALPNYRKSFDNVYLITTDGIYSIFQNNQQVKKTEYSFNDMVQQMKKMLNVD